MPSRWTEDENPYKKARVSIDEHDEGIFSYQMTNSMGQTFTPMALQYVWYDPDTIMKCLTVSIPRPSDIRPSGVESLRVLDGDRELEIKIKWPKRFYDVEKLQKTKLYGTPAASLESFRKWNLSALVSRFFVKPLRSRDNEKIQSLGRILLLMSVQSHILNREFNGAI